MTENQKCQLLTYIATAKEHLAGAVDMVQQLQHKNGCASTGKAVKSTAPITSPRVPIR